MRSVIKKDSVQTGPGLARSAAGDQATAPQLHGQRVRLLRSEGVVRALEISCTCGETTLVELDYSNPPEESR